MIADLVVTKRFRREVSRNGACSYGQLAQKASKDAGVSLPARPRYLVLGEERRSEDMIVPDSDPFTLTVVEEAVNG